MKRVSLIILLAIVSLSAAPVVQANPGIQANSAILLDAKTGQVLWDKNMHKRCAPASTTKVLTAIIAIERANLDEKITVSPRAAATRGSSMYLFPGQVLALRELLEGLLLRSGNDAAVAIAEHVAGTATEFAQLMNEKALVLGARDSHFVNPNGLSAPNHYSSAYDLAVIARYALQNPVFASIVRLRETNIDWVDRRGKEQEKVIRNTNKLLWMFADADGIKTGTTSEAGPCLIASATRGGQKLISVVLHDHERWSDSMRLLQYGFQHYDTLEYAAQGDVLVSLPVLNGLQPEVSVKVADAAAVTVRAEELADTTVEVDLPETIKAPVFQGQKIGEITFYTREKAIKVVDIIADSNVEEKTVSRLLLSQLTSLYRLLSGWGML